MRKMKDSGIAWIGEIPEEWKILTLKYTSWLKGRIGWQGLKSTEFIDDGPYLITGTDFDHGTINWNTCVHITNERFEEDEDIHIEENDLLITKDGTIGKVAIVKECPKKVSLNSGILLIRNNKIPYENKFVYYVLLSDEFALWYEFSQPQNSTIRHLYQGQFYNFKYAFPPLDEQRRIAAFLDEKCAHIDAVIEKTRVSIDEYKKLKQAVITRAVTKGLRQGRKMKDSGIEWIGEICDDFSVRRLKFLLEEPLMYGANETGIPYDETLPRYIRITDITLDGKLKDTGKLSLTQEEAQPYLLNDGDILLARSGASVGKTFIYKKEYGISAFASYLIRARAKESICPKFIFYYTQSSLYEEWKQQIFIQSTIQNIGADRYSQLPIVLPPLPEQKEIAAYLDAKTAAIDRLIEKKEQLIAEMQSCKKSLIYEVVTGKREVAI